MSHAPNIGAVVSLVALASAVSAPQAITYSASSDFNIVANPRGVLFNGTYLIPANRCTGFDAFNSNFIDNSVTACG